MTTTITTAEAVKKMFERAGTVFSVTFYKKGKKNGEGKNELREMRARHGSTVKKGLAGGEAAYNPADHGLVWVYLMKGDKNRDEAKNRRAVSVAGITRLAIGGEVFNVDGEPWA